MAATVYEGDNWDADFMHVHNMFIIPSPLQTPPDGSSDREMTVGNLSNDECDEGSENVVKKKRICILSNFIASISGPALLVKCSRFLVELIS